MIEVANPRGVASQCSLPKSEGRQGRLATHGELRWRAVETPPHLPSKQPVFADPADHGRRKAMCNFAATFQVARYDGI
jgi:hypothetical protein